MEWNSDKRVGRISISKVDRWQVGDVLGSLKRGQDSTIQIDIQRHNAASLGAFYFQYSQP